MKKPPLLSNPMRESAAAAAESVLGVTKNLATLVRYDFECDIIRIIVTTTLDYQFQLGAIVFDGVLHYYSTTLERQATRLHCMAHTISTLAWRSSAH